MAIIDVRLDENIGVGNSIKGTIASYLSQRNKNNCSLNYRLGNDNYKFKYNNYLTLVSKDNPIVYLHENFVYGNQNANFYPYILQTHIDLLNDLFEKIFNNKILEGTNKPSDRNKNGIIYEPYLEGYYHYHCGPYQESKDNYINNLSEENWSGSKSGPAIHYLKYEENGKDIFIIVAFVISHGKEPRNPSAASFKEKNKIMNTF